MRFRKNSVEKKNSIFRKNPKLSLRKIQKLNISQVFWLNLLNRAVKKLNQKLKELNLWIHLNLPLFKKRTKKKLAYTYIVLPPIKKISGIRLWKILLSWLSIKYRQIIALKKHQFNAFQNQLSFWC